MLNQYTILPMKVSVSFPIPIQFKIVLYEIDSKQRKKKWQDKKNGNKFH